MGFFRQFGLLLWKNFLLQRRRPLGTAFEIGLPAFFIIILVALRHVTIKQDVFRCERPLTEKDIRDSNCEWPSLDPLVVSASQKQCNWSVAFAPAAAQSIMDEATKFISETVNLTAFPDEDTLVKHLMDPQIPVGCKLGVVINQTAARQFTLKLRMDSTPGGFVQGQNQNGPPQWFTQFSFPSFLGQGAREDGNPPPDAQGNYPGYGTYGFLMWQTAISRGVMNTIPGQNLTEVLDNVRLQRFPYPRYLHDEFIYAVQFGFPMLLMLSMVFTALSITREIVHEKERRLKESMKMMGLYNAVHWAAWYFKCFLFLMISVVMMTLLLAGGKVLRYSDVSLIFVYLMLFATSTISWAFLISVLFSKASTAAAVSGILWFMSYVPYFFIQPRYDTLTYFVKQSVCGLSTTAMAMGANVIAIQETNGDGVTWSNVMKPISINDSFTFGTVLGMQLWDTVLYFFLAWYLEQVFPGDFGIPRPFYFPLMPSYWCGQRALKDDEIPLDDIKMDVGPTFQRDPPLHAGIRLVGLRKEFTGNKVAVNNIHLNMYQGQITALLGHNGAGKSTTMNLITGLFPPTKGTVYVENMDIRMNIRQVQETLGICPQHDVLFDTLTVREHLVFFCKLKGVTGSQIDVQVNDMLRDLQLEDKRDERSMNLSGGQKRRLSCGIALVGGSKIVILDEPTSGMDPSARRATWDLLARHKAGRTILLSTHFMDEADLLGDRIAIMADGVVKCCGDSLFLKQHYGIGYHLTMVKDTGCRAQEVHEFLQRFVPGTVLEGDVGAELTFLLPREHSRQFADMFDTLEKEQVRLRISGYGCSVTTMEEVFLRVGEGGAGNEEDKIDIQARIERRAPPGNMQRATENVEVHDNHMAMLVPDQATRLTGFRLSVAQFRAMLVKRFLHSKRNKMAILTQLLPPLLFTFMSLMIARTYSNPENSKPRDFTNYFANYGANNLWVTPHTYNGTTNPLAEDLANVSATLFDASGLKTFVVPLNSSALEYNTTSEFLWKEAGPTTPLVAAFNSKNMYLLDFHPENTTVSPTAWFNGQGYHTIVESLNLMMNAILTVASGPDSEIKVVNHPLPLTIAEQANNQRMSGLGFIIAFNIVFGMAPLASSFVLFLVAERYNKAKLVQFVSGVSPFSYWTSTYLWDYINYLVPSTLCIILFIGFDVAEFSGARLGYVVFLFISYGLAILPMMYLATFMFDNASVAFTRMTLFNIVTGLAAMMTINILQLLDKLSLAKTLKHAFLFLPNFCFGNGLVDIYSNYQAIELIKESGKCVGVTLEDCCEFAEQILDFDLVCNGNYLDWRMPGIGMYLTCLYIQAFFFGAVLMFIEYRVFSRLFGSVRGQPENKVLTMNEDVVFETQRVAHQLGLAESPPAMDVETEARSADILLVHALSKDFTARKEFCGRSTTKHAVDHLSFGVPTFECFGLLGVNGAGKTTTFRMLTGDVAPDYGGATVSGFSITNNMTAVRQRLGYCPQFDALIDLMTGREVLTMFARLRGVREKDVPLLVADIIELLMLEKHADKLTKAYSGGTKRKLSTGIAFIGEPPLLLLDEPTTGMDPGARRFLWDALCRVRQDGRAIVLTSHSMEECEALCTRLGIMVNGQFQCIGTPQQLKTRFGAGLTLIVRLHDTTNVVPFKAFIEARFPGSQLKEEHGVQLKYVVPRQSWAVVFRTMEEATERCNLEDYSASQTTLEEIFLDFAKHQHDSVV